MLRYLSHNTMLHLFRKLHYFCKVQESNIYSKNIIDVIVKVVFKNRSYLPLSIILVESTITNALTITAETTITVL